MEESARTPAAWTADLGPTDAAFDEGVLVGVLIGEGHFGGDGRQPQVTLRMHARHEPLFRWIEQRFPGGRLYGPYHHGGRHYFQWMARGAYLREVLLPILERRLIPGLDLKASEAVAAMRARYVHQLEAARTGAGPTAAGPDAAALTGRDTAP
jgi:hypothetical protein